MPSFNRSADCYTLFLKKKWSDMERFYEENTLDLFLPLNNLRDTALHLAVYSKNIQLVESLLKIVYEDNPFLNADFGLSLKNAAGNTPLHEAASTGNVELVRLILRYDTKSEQLTANNNDGQTPFFMAAIYGQTDLIKDWVKDLTHIDEHVWSGNSTMLHEAIRGYYFETALELLDPKYRIPKDRKDLYGMTCFQLLADIPSAFKSGHSFGILEKLIYDGLPVPEDKDESENNNVSQVNPSPKTDTNHGNSSTYFRWIWGLIAIGYPSFQSLRKMKKEHDIVVKLTKILAKDDVSWQGHNTADGAMPKTNSDSTDDPMPEENNTSTDGPKPKEYNNTTDGQGDTPLMAAAKNGITEIVEAILEVFPQAIEHENHKEENLFHIAVQNRTKNVLDHLESNKLYSRLLQKFNADGDGILHKAAYKSDISSRERPGEALCLQSDIQWFERVRKMVPAHHVNLQNKKEYTPQSLFTKEHEKLVKKGQEWLIRTTNSCIIVAVLIATVAFTSIYTVPGGSNAKTGKPLLLNTTAFTVFTASDVASLCFAFTSVVVFLSITTSKMNEQDFRMSLPLKLVLGLSMLFFSVAALMIGFAATLVMTIRHRLHQAAAPIIAIACFPVAFFLLLQLPLYTNITCFTIEDLLRSLIGIFTPKKCQPRSMAGSSHIIVS